MATEFTYTPEEFFARVKSYHKTVENSGEFPDLAGLKNFLDIEDEEYEQMVFDPAYYKAIRWARRRRESYLNRLATTSKNSNGIKMLLAQPENGGYVEKPVDKTPRQVVVTLRGMPDDDDDDVDSDNSDTADSDDSPEVPDKQSGSEDGEGSGQSGKLSGKTGRGRGKAKRTGV